MRQRRDAGTIQTNEHNRRDPHFSFRAVATGQFSRRLVTMKHPPARALKSRFTPSHASLEFALSKIKTQRPINTRRWRGKAGSVFLPNARPRKIIGEIFEISNRSKLPNDSVEDFFNRWLESVKIESNAKTHQRYSSIIERFLAWLGQRAKLGIQHLTTSDPDRRAVPSSFARDRRDRRPAGAAFSASIRNQTT